MEFISDYIVPIGKEGLKIVDTGKWRTRKPVMDKSKCIKCGMCFMYCPVNSIRKLADGSFEICYARAAASALTSVRRRPLRWNR